MPIITLFSTYGTNVFTTNRTSHTQSKAQCPFLVQKSQLHKHLMVLHQQLQLCISYQDYCCWLVHFWLKWSLQKRKWMHLSGMLKGKGILRCWRTSWLYRYSKYERLQFFCSKEESKFVRGRKRKKDILILTGVLPEGGWKLKSIKKVNLQILDTDGSTVHTERSVIG